MQICKMWTFAGKVKAMLAAQEREFTDVGLFELVDRSESEDMASNSTHPCAPPLTEEEWPSYFDSAGQSLLLVLL